MTGVLVVAKAPVEGAVKTRLGARVGMARAADLAAAALADTLAACTAAFGSSRCALALEGDLEKAVGGAGLRAAVDGWTVFPQQGDAFGERLRLAHEEARALLDVPVVQVGMDTPQLTPAMLLRAAGSLVAPHDAVLGPALDGGWWLLGVGDPTLLAGLDDVPMSTSTTGAATRALLLAAGAQVHEVEELRDVDTVADADAVSGLAPATRFAEVWR